MTAHDHTNVIAGCYRCELGEDEARDARANAEREAQEAWLDYRNRVLQRTSAAWTPAGSRRVIRRLRRREFIAGYLAAEGIES